MSPIGVQRKDLIRRWFLTSSTPETRYQARGVTVYASHTCSRSSGPASVARSLGLALKPSEGGSATTPAHSRRNSGSSSCSPTSPPWGKKGRPVCVGMTWRRLLAAGTMRQWRARLEDIKREARQFGIRVRGRMEQVALRPRVHHEARNSLILTDCSNAINTVKEDGSACRGGHLRAGTRRSQQNATERGPPPYSSKRIQGSGERSNVPAQCSKGTPWARRCSA